ncbi:ionotropic receptor 21a-like [Panulirus ornatus]|uniref:ionotropic receptor 21a-like n=1 Tax=Panulirus ornatus TaxID=150431 RepID=UPI003A89F304
MQNLSFAWYYAFGLHFCESHEFLPRNPCTQIFVQFLWLYTMIMTISYTASLRSFLLVKKEPYMIQTIQELYESGLEVGAPSNLYKNEFAASANPYLQGLTRVYKYHDALEDIYIPVLQGRAVYLGNGISMAYLKNRFSRQGTSLLRVMKESYRSYSVGLGLQRHSPLKKKFDVVVGLIQQSGLYSKFTYDSLKLHDSLQKDDGGLDDSELRTDGVVALNIDNMQGLFIITVFGWLCGFFSFMLEKTILSN